MYKIIDKILAGKRGPGGARNCAVVAGPGASNAKDSSVGCSTQCRKAIIIRHYYDYCCCCCLAACAAAAGHYDLKSRAAGHYDDCYALHYY